MGFLISKHTFFRLAHLLKSVVLIMAALRSRCGHCIYFAAVGTFFFFLGFSSPNLSGRRLDVYHTSTHALALVRM